VDSFVSGLAGRDVSSPCGAFRARMVIIGVVLLTRIPREAWRRRANTARTALNA
jgi:hypothetical protein